jgi:hypothetical protein
MGHLRIRVRFHCTPCDIESKLLDPLSRTLSRGVRDERMRQVELALGSRNSRTAASIFCNPPRPGWRSATFSFRTGCRHQFLLSRLISTNSERCRKRVHFPPFGLLHAKVRSGCMRIWLVPPIMKCADHRPHGLRSLSFRRRVHTISERASCQRRFSFIDVEQATCRFRDVERHRACTGVDGDQRERRVGGVLERHDQH